MPDQRAYVSGGNCGRLLGLLVGEVESDAFGGGEAGPVAAGQPAKAFLQGLIIKARDREQHLAMPHSVEAVQRPRHDPEQALLEDAILLRFLGKGPRAG